MFDERHNVWKKFSVPSVAELFNERIKVENNDTEYEFKKYNIGIFSSKADVDYYLQESRLMDFIKSNKSGEIIGVYRYDERWYSYQMSYDTSDAHFESAPLTQKEAEIYLNKYKKQPAN